jgi:hypothetical protein
MSNHNTGPNSIEKTFNSVPSNSSFLEKDTDPGNEHLNLLKTAEDQLREALDKSYTRDKLSKQIKFNAVCLKHLPNTRAEDRGKVRIKARIPELHYMLPLPTAVNDYETMALYPTFEAYQSSFNPQPTDNGNITPGTIIVVTFGNQSNFAQPQILEITSIRNNSNNSPNRPPPRPPPGGGGGGNPRPPRRPGGRNREITSKTNTHRGAIRRNCCLLSSTSPRATPIYKARIGTHQPNRLPQCPSGQLLGTDCHVQSNSLFREQVEYYVKQRGVSYFLPRGSSHSLIGRSNRAELRAHIIAEEVQKLAAAGHNVGFSLFYNFTTKATRRIRGRGGNWQNAASIAKAQFDHYKHLIDHYHKDKPGAMLPSINGESFYKWKIGARPKTWPGNTKEGMVKHNINVLLEFAKMVQTEYGKKTLMYLPIPGQLASGIPRKVLQNSAEVRALFSELTQYAWWWLPLYGNQHCCPRAKANLPKSSPTTLAQKVASIPRWKRGLYKYYVSLNHSSGGLWTKAVMWQFAGPAFFEMTPQDVQTYRRGIPNPGDRGNNVGAQLFGLNSMDAMDFEALKW